MARLHQLSSSGTTPQSSPDGAAHPLAERASRIINLIRPAIQADGGDIEFVSVTAENVVQIRMHGACVGCPSSSVTLQTGIERNLREHIPEIRGVVAIE